ncbi:acyltransferase family protein [Dyella sp. 2RAB6]|uniref:acyltransferase family protein n=1 Tax=Dyella sp. 2RAB6 TaxID=3232992 RepID=UPI003F93BA25
MTGRTRLDGIESLRAYAAVSIVFFHLIGSGGATVPDSLSFIKTHFGFGVPLFFVVSGFSLAYGYWGRLSGEGQLGTYFLRRFARIAPLFYAVLAFQLLNVWFEAHVKFAPLDVALNALFVFNLVPHLNEGIVPASWTIGVEMLFYVIFPLSLLVCSNLRRTLFVLAVSIAVSTAATIDLKSLETVYPSFVYHNAVSQLPYFIWGMAFFHVQRVIAQHVDARHARMICWGLCALGLAGIYTLYASSTLYMFFWTRGLRPTWDMLWGIPFGMLCLAMALHPSRLLSNPVTRYLGKISFSLYLVHPTVLFKFGRAGLYNWVYAKLPGHEALAYFVCLLISLAVITAISAVTFRLIEQPGMNWGKRLASRKEAVLAPA